MDHTYWLKQTDNEPLFPDIIWSRPENKAGAGKLAILGGNEHSFSAPAIAYTSATNAGSGVIHVLLPDAIRRVVKNILPDADYAPSTPSGSFSKKSVGDMTEAAAWSDMTLLAGDFGRNSETAIALETFALTYQGPLTITQDAVEYFRETPALLVDRKDTLIVLSLSQLQKIFINTPSIIPITLSMNTVQLVEALHGYTLKHAAMLVTVHGGLLYVAVQGRVSTTACNKDIWRVESAARMCVFWMHNTAKQFETVTTAAVEL